MDNIETLQEGFRISGNEKIAPALTKRDSIPPAIRDILGVTDDPIERLIQTNQNNLKNLPSGPQSFLICVVLFN